MIKEYRVENEKSDRKEFFEDLKYWCNACGELHHHGKHDITEEELPLELKNAYDNLWTDGNGSLCYLVEYKGTYGIALINEFDEEYAKNNGSTMEKVFSNTQEKAKSFSEKELLKEAVILLGENTGFDECHEFIVILPCETEKKAFDDISNLLYKEMYK